MITRIRIIWLFIYFNLIVSTALAGEGCVIGSTVYSSRASTVLSLEVLGSNKVFSEVGSPTNSCNPPSTEGSCSVCINGGSAIDISLIGAPVIVCSLSLLNNYPPTTGSYYSNYILNCNLDDYSWTLGAAAGLFGIFVIRRRNKP